MLVWTQCKAKLFGDFPREKEIMADPRIPGTLAVTGKQTSLEHGIQAYRGVTNFGLRVRPLAPGTIQITAGTSSAGVNTVRAFVNSVAISLEVDWTTSHAATAALLAVAINLGANGADGGTPHNYVATVSTDTVTVRQRSSGAVTGALTATVGGDVLATVVDFSIDTDTWAEHVSGAAFDGDEYYEIGFDSSLIFDADFTDAANILLIDTRFYVNGQAWEYWANGFRAIAAATALEPGIPIATVTFELIEWLNAGGLLVFKLAADSTLYFKSRFI